MNLDINNWKEFTFGRLICSIVKAKALNRDDLQIATNEKSGIRYITRTGENNGCEFLAELSSVDSSFIQEGNAITIGDTTATCFYQSEEFITGDHMVVIRADWLDEILALYVVTILNKEQYKYSYGRAFLMDRIKNTLIKLPIILNDDGTIYNDTSKKYSDDGYVPDWQWMENYIRSLHHKPLATRNKGTNVPQLNISSWKEFALKMLFNVELSKGDIKLDDVDRGTIPLVSSGESNNGIVGNIDEKGDGKAEIFKGNKITIDMFGNPFYQENDFYAVSHGRVNILEPKFELNKPIGLFIASIIKKEQYKFSYGRAVYSEEASNMIIELPVQHNNDGTPCYDANRTYSDDGYIPDWVWMENYIKSLPYGDRL